MTRSWREPSAAWQETSQAGGDFNQWQRRGLSSAWWGTEGTFLSGSEDQRVGALAGTLTDRGLSLLRSVSRLMSRLGIAMKSCMVIYNDRHALPWEAVVLNPHWDYIRGPMNSRSADEQVSSLSGLLTVTSRTRAAIPSQLCRQTIEVPWEWVDSQANQSCYSAKPWLSSSNATTLFSDDSRSKKQISSHIFMDTGYLILYGHRSEMFDIAWRSGPTAGVSPPVHKLITRVLQCIIWGTRSLYLSVMESEIGGGVLSWSLLILPGRYWRV